MIYWLKAAVFAVADIFFNFFFVESHFLDGRKDVVDGIFEATRQAANFFFMSSEYAKAIVVLVSHALPVPKTVPFPNPPIRPGHQLRMRNKYSTFVSTVEFRMNRIWVLLPALLLFACGSATSEPPVVKGDSTLYYPYPAIYTESYAPGKARQAAIVLDFWKELEHGDVRKSRPAFADTVFLALPELVFRGPADSVLSLLHQRRRQYADVQLFVDSWMPVHANDPDEDLVLLWGRQDGARLTKGRDYHVVHEIWRFNKAGKIKALNQYRTHPF